MNPTSKAKLLLEQFPRMRLPVRLHTICDKLGIQIRYAVAPVESFDAFYIEGLERDISRLIIVNDAFPLTHQRFSVAHEIGHIVLGHGSSNFLAGKIKNDRESSEEIAANRFAAELLMPASRILQQKLTKPEQISYVCHVSLEAARIRLSELTFTTQRTAV